MYSASCRECAELEMEAEAEVAVGRAYGSIGHTKHRTYNTNYHVSVIGPG